MEVIVNTKVVKILLDTAIWVVETDLDINLTPAKVKELLGEEHTLWRGNQLFGFIRPGNWLVVLTYLNKGITPPRVIPTTKVFEAIRELREVAAVRRLCSTIIANNCVCTEDMITELDDWKNANAPYWPLAVDNFTEWLNMRPTTNIMLGNKFLLNSVVVLSRKEVAAFFGEVKTEKERHWVATYLEP